MKIIQLGLIKIAKGPSLLLSTNDRRLTRLFLSFKRIRCMHWPTSLLDGALGTAFFERLLRFFDFALGLAREDGERHIGDGILRFLQAQVGEATHNLNDGNALVGVNGIDDEVELSLFLGGFGGRAGGGRHDHAARRGGGVDAEHFFNLRDELGRFEELRIDTKHTQTSSVSHSDSIRDVVFFSRGVPLVDPLASGFSPPNRDVDTVHTRDATRASTPRREDTMTKTFTHRSHASQFVDTGRDARHETIVDPPSRPSYRPPRVGLAGVHPPIHPSRRVRVCVFASSRRRTVSVFISSMMASVFAEARTTDVRAAAAGRAAVV